MLFRAFLWLYEDLFLWSDNQLLLGQWPRNTASPGSVLHELYALWRKRGCSDEYIGTLVNAFLEEGGEAFSVAAGEVYVDVGTLNGYREAMRVLGKQNSVESSSFSLALG